MGKVISAAERARKLSAAKELAYASAITTYIESHAAYAESSDPHRKSPVSLHDLVSLHNGLITKTTLSRRVPGGRSKSQVAHMRTKLKHEEEALIVRHIRKEGDKGHPCTHRFVLGLANDILRARCKREHITFQPVGKNWSGRFVERHSDQIKTYWTKSLQGVRAKSVCLSVLEGWNNLRGKAQCGDLTDGTPILPKNIANMDKTGWLPSVHQTRRVIGPAGKKIQYEVESGLRENITMIGTIMADGTSTRPIVIFLGVNLQTRWGTGDPDHNIANA